MTPTAFASYKEKISTLSSEQKKELMDCLAFQGIEKPVVLEQLNVADDWLLQGFMEVLKDRQIVSSTSLVAIVKSKAFIYYKKYSSSIKEDLLKNVPQVKTMKNTKLALAYTTGAAIIHWCERRKLKVTYNVFFNNAHHAITALEEQFPDYARSGLLHLIVRG